MKKLAAMALGLIAGLCMYLVISTGVSAPFLMASGAKYGEIYTATQLQNMLVHGRYVLTADIDMTGVAWTPLNFAGTLNGDNHMITGLDGVLVGTVVGATIRNIHVHGNGGLVDQMFDGIVENTSFEGIGGIIGTANGTVHVKNVHARGDSPIVNTVAGGATWIMHSSVIGAPIIENAISGMTIIANSHAQGATQLYTATGNAIVYIDGATLNCDSVYVMNGKPAVQDGYKAVRWYRDEFAGEDFFRLQPLLSESPALYAVLVSNGNQNPPCDDDCDEYAPYDGDCDDDCEEPTDCYELPPIPGGQCDDGDDVVTSVLPQTPSHGVVGNGASNSHAIIFAALGGATLLIIGVYLVLRRTKRRG